MTAPDSNRLSRLRFRAWRRGFRELDLILGPFADRYVADLPADELDALEALLDEADQDVYAWIIGQLPPPAAFEGPLLERLRLFQRNLPIASGDLSGS